MEKEKAINIFIIIWMIGTFGIIILQTIQKSASVIISIELLIALFLLLVERNTK